MRPRTWIALPFLLATVFALADDKAKPTFDLNDASVRKIVREAASTTESAPQPGAGTKADESTAAIDLGSPLTTRIGTLPMRKGRLPMTTHCDGVTEDCGVYDASGNELYRIPRWQVFGASAQDHSIPSPCQSSNNLLSTFERADRCRGVGLLLPTPWDKVNFLLPITNRH